MGVLLSAEVLEAFEAVIPFSTTTLDAMWNLTDEGLAEMIPADVELFKWGAGIWWRRFVRDQKAMGWAVADNLLKPRVWGLIFAQFTMAGTGTALGVTQSHHHHRRRDGLLGDAFIKLAFDPYDPGQRGHMRVADFHVNHVNNDTGVAEFLWTNTTSWQRYGGNMTNVWLHKDGSLKFLSLIHI